MTFCSRFQQGRDLLSEHRAGGCHRADVIGLSPAGAQTSGAVPCEERVSVAPQGLAPSMATRVRPGSLRPSIRAMARANPGGLAVLTCLRCGGSQHFDTGNHHGPAIVLSVTD